MARGTAKANYAIRALVELAAVEPQRLTSEQLSAAQDIPLRFLHNILGDLTRTQLVVSRRGTVGGYRLGRPANEITIADVVAAVEGRPVTPPSEEYAGVPLLGEVWELVQAPDRAGVQPPVTRAV
jgi:Rrf2 family protein